MSKAGRKNNSYDGVLYRYAAATQFQGIAARQMFPCFDEPDMKATFNVTVVSKPESVALSNMPLIATEQRSFSSLLLLTKSDASLNNFLEFHLCPCNIDSFHSCLINITVSFMNINRHRWNTNYIYLYYFLTQE